MILHHNGGTTLISSIDEPSVNDPREKICSLVVNLNNQYSIWSVGFNHHMYVWFLTDK